MLGQHFTAFWVRYPNQIESTFPITCWNVVPVCSNKCKRKEVKIISSFILFILLLFFLLLLSLLLALNFRLGYSTQIARYSNKIILCLTDKECFKLSFSYKLIWSFIDFPIILSFLLIFTFFLKFHRGWRESRSDEENSCKEKVKLQSRDMRDRSYEIFFHRIFIWNFSL